MQLVAEYGQRTEHNVSILFAHGSVFVGGQLLRANRGVYEGALELGDDPEQGRRRRDRHPPRGAGRATSTPSPPCSPTRCASPSRPRSSAPRRTSASAASPRRRCCARTSWASASTPSVQVARTYASAVVIMRRFFEDLRRGQYELPQRVKRVAQRLVDLSMGETPAFLGVTAARNQNHDEAGRAVNTAILALAMTRQVDGRPGAALARRHGRAALRLRARPHRRRGRRRRPGRSSRSSASSRRSRRPRARPWCSPRSAASTSRA